MKSTNALRLFSFLTLLAILCVPSVRAGKPEAAAANDRVEDRVEAASCQRCGDGYCAPSCENERTCPADCQSTKLRAPAAPEPAPIAARCGKCGDGRCVKTCGETAETCPADCGSTTTGSAPPAKQPACEPSAGESQPET